MNKDRIFDIVVHEAEEGGYWSECPTLKGCYAQGETLEEVKNNIQEAIRLCIEEMESNKKRLPKQRRTFLIPVEIKV